MSDRAGRPALLMAVSAATAMIVCGCGGGDRGGQAAVPITVQAGPATPTTPSAGTATASAGSQPRRGRPEFRWVGPHAPLRIVAENALDGTGDWRMPGPAADAGGLRFGDVQGYVSEQAIEPGHVERIYVSAPGNGTVRIRIFRIGWYGGLGGRQVLVTRRLPLRPQPNCDHTDATGLTECNWHPTLQFTIPPWLKSGVFIAKLSTYTGVSDVMFVVRSTAGAPILVQLPTATYEADNAWGGDSLSPQAGDDLVKATGTTEGIEVSFDRPYDSITGAGGFFAQDRDVALVEFLERYGYPVAYTTDESVDHDPGQLIDHRVLIAFGHDDYWSERQADGFARAANDGTSELFLASDSSGSADALPSRVRYEPATAAGSQPGGAEQTIVADKEFAAVEPVAQLAMITSSLLDRALERPRPRLDH